MSGRWDDGTRIHKDPNSIVAFPSVFIGSCSRPISPCSFTRTHFTNIHFHSFWFSKALELLSRVFLYISFYGEVSHMIPHCFFKPLPRRLFIGIILDFHNGVSADNNLITNLATLESCEDTQPGGEDLPGVQNAHHKYSKTHDGLGIPPLQVWRRGDWLLRVSDLHSSLILHLQGQQGGCSYLLVDTEKAGITGSV